MSLNIEQCRLCGQAVHEVGTAPGYQRGQTFSIFECEGCLVSFASPAKTDGALYDLIYSNIRFVPGYNRYFNYAHAVLKQWDPLAYLSRQEESYWAVAHHVAARRKAGDKAKILEVGCGMGYFSYALHESGFNVTGVDLSPHAVAWAHDHYGSFYECASLQQLDARNEKYDVIVMNQLIEHISELHTFIAESIALLSPNGELILTTPNKSAFPDAVWETELPPVHLWWFGEKAMSVMAQRHECEITFIDFSLFYDACTRGRSLGTPLKDRHPVFDENGGLLISQLPPSQTLCRTLLERTGLQEVFRSARMRVTRNEPWQGARGPITACVLKPLQVDHD